MAGRFARRLIAPAVCAAVAACAAAWWHAPLLRSAAAHESATGSPSGLAPPAVSYGRPSPGPAVDRTPYAPPRYPASPSADLGRSLPRARITGAYALPYRAASSGTVGGLGPGGQPGPSVFPASSAALSAGVGSGGVPAPVDDLEQGLPGPIWPAESPAAPARDPTAEMDGSPGAAGGMTASSVLFEESGAGQGAAGLRDSGAVDSLGTGYSSAFAGAPVGRARHYVGWQLLPHGLMYPSYLAGAREPRFGSRWFHITDDKWYWDPVLGGRVGMLRFGSFDTAWPEGWQLDVAGGAFPRLSLEEHRELVSVDFRIGVPLTLRRGPWEWKFAYYHLSSHLGDEYMLRHPRPRFNYVREALVWAVAWRPWPDLRLYAEADFAFYTDGGAEPWAFQFGADYSPVTPAGIWGAPFVAVNGHLREENDFGGNVTFQTGWQWRASSGHLLRFGFHYFNGMSPQCQFLNEHEEQIGVGFWYDY